MIKRFSAFAREQRRTKLAGARSSSIFKERGLKCVRLITSDACIGLAERLQSSFLTRPGNGASCHAAMLKAIHASEDIAAAREKAFRVREAAWPAAGQAAELAGSGGRGDTRLLCLPGGALAADSHQQPARAHPARDAAAQLVVGAFPDGQSALNLAAARLRHIAGTPWSIRDISTSSC